MMRNDSSDVESLEGIAGAQSNLFLKNIKETYKLILNQKQYKLINNDKNSTAV